MTAASKRWMSLVNCEAWRPVYGWDGWYEVSSFGRVRSIARTHIQSNGVHSYPSTILKRIYRRGYPCVALTRPGIRRHYYVHHLVLLAFVGMAAKGQEACHCNGDKHNNTVANLRWDSRAANNADKIKHGTVPRGEKHPLHKLTDSLVREIRLSAESTHSIARRTGISQMTIYRARHRFTWGHVT